MLTTEEQAAVRDALELWKDNKRVGDLHFFYRIPWEASVELENALSDKYEKNYVCKRLVEYG